MNHLKIKQWVIVPDDIRKIGNILAIPAVESLNKKKDGGFMLILSYGKRGVIAAEPGDVLVELEGGRWDVVPKEDAALKGSAQNDK